ncbi:MAG: alpha/beta hydrolase [Lentisphaerae bacterium]|nr:alpha/beta hydrolase [Lentisphaerota bacterium]
MENFTTDYPGKSVQWHGFECLEFTLDGLRCYMVKPPSGANADRNWYWRVHFFGAFPDADFAMLKLGWHVVHIEVHELYGNNECMRRMDLLYNFMISLGFNKKCVPVGYSRGGLDVYRWASLNPEKVSCLYLDNPVCDIKSWPGGKGIGPGGVQEWQNCLNAWHFTEEDAMKFAGNPVDDLQTLADNHIPILHLCADADELVPAAENTAILEKRYRALGGHIEVIWKPGAKHHPHCLSDPAPIVDFIHKFHK